MYQSARAWSANGEALGGRQVAKLYAGGRSVPAFCWRCGLRHLAIRVAAASTVVPVRLRERIRSLRLRAGLCSEKPSCCWNMHGALTKKRRSRKRPFFVKRITFESHNFIKVGRFMVRILHQRRIPSPVPAATEVGIWPVWRNGTNILPTLMKLWLSNVILLT